jgi:signal transduction histidine kinase
MLYCHFQKHSRTPMAYPDHRSNDSPSSSPTYLRGMERLVVVVQELSLARDVATVTAIVRRAARELTGADGATFILRELDKCHYVDEDAIGPLWKGRKFPMSACISGWAMTHRREAVIEDIYADPRIPHDAYRPTFVKSLAMVPVRTLDPIGAIGNYWARRHRPTEHEVRLLQALADTTAVALENVQVYAELERRVRDRTAELEAVNKELESFSYSVSHDLRAPVRAIGSFCALLREDHERVLDGEARRKLGVIESEAERMGSLIEGLLDFSRSGRSALKPSQLDMTQIASSVFDRLTAGQDARPEFRLGSLPGTAGDRTLIEQVWTNLLGNAIKFSSKKSDAVIDVSGSCANGECTYVVSDNGAGFDPKYAANLFGVFQRLHSDSDFPGTGIGLALVQRIVARHGGSIAAESVPGAGATFRFTLPSTAVPLAE